MNSILNSLLAFRGQSAIPRVSSAPQAALLMRTIDRAIPTRILLGDPEQLQRARSIIGFALILVVLAIQAAIYFEWAMPIEAARWVNSSAIVAQRVLEGLNAPFSFDSHEVFISASIGIALYPGTVATMDELLRNADLAMYHAKSEGRNNFQFFEESMNDSVVEQTTVAHALRRALDRGELELYYQPILSASSGEIVALECLVRWNDPTYSLIQPEKFIGVAEQSGLIVDLGEWVIGEACARYARWRDAGIAPGRIGINVSGQQFREQ